MILLLKSGKNPREDGIPVELYKTCLPEGLCKLIVADEVRSKLVRLMKWYYAGTKTCIRPTVKSIVLSD